MTKRERDGGARLLVQALPTSATYEKDGRSFMLPMYTEGSGLPVVTVAATIGKGKVLPMTFGHHRLLAKEQTETSSVSFGFLGAIAVQPSALAAGGVGELVGAAAAPCSWIAKSMTSLPKATAAPAQNGPQALPAHMAISGFPEEVAPFAKSMLASSFAFRQHSAFTNAIAVARASTALTPLTPQQKRLKVDDKYSLQMIASRERTYDARLNTYTLLINPSAATPSVGAFQIFQINGGELSKNEKKTRLPYELILKRPEAEKAEERKIIIFGNSLAVLFAEEALARNDKGQPCLSSEKAKAEVPALVHDAIFILGASTGNATHCSLHAVVRSYDHIDHIELRDRDMHARFNDALEALEVGGGKIDASIQAQLQHGHVVPVLGSNRRFDDNFLLLLARDEVNCVLGEGAADSLAAIRHPMASAPPPAYTNLLELSDFELLSLCPRGRRRSASASAGGAAPGGAEDDGIDADDEELDAMLAESFPAGPTAPAAPAAPPMVLTEFIDTRGLHEATTQIEAILADAETTGTLKARAESHLYYLRSLEGTLSPEVLGPLDIPCRTLVAKYERKRDFGRRIAKTDKWVLDAVKNEPRFLCLQGAPAVLRPFLCGRYTRDYDLVNCQPTLLLQVSKRLSWEDPNRTPTPLPKLEQWVRNRDEMIEHVAEVYGLTGSYEEKKDQAKALVTAMMFGGGVYGWVKNQGLTHVDMEHMKSPIITKLHTELQALRNDVFDSIEWRTHVGQERARHAELGEKGAAAADRSIMACIAQNYENDILRAMEASAAAQGWTVLSLQYDGLHLRERPDRQLDLEAMEAAIKAATGFEMQVKEKPLFCTSWPALCLKKPGDARGAASTPAVARHAGGLGPLMDPVAMASVDATDADAVHRAILAGLDENVPAAGFILSQGGGVWLARQTMRGAPSALGDLGGKKDSGETLWQAAVREVFEEGGLDLSGARLATTDQVFYGCKHTGERSYVFFFLETVDAPKMTGDKRIEEHVHLTAPPEWSTLHPRMQFAAGLRTRLQKCFA